MIVEWFIDPSNINIEMEVQLEASSLERAVQIPEL